MAGELGLKVEVEGGEDNTPSVAGGLAPEVEGLSISDWGAWPGGGGGE